MAMYCLAINDIQFISAIHIQLRVVGYWICVLFKMSATAVSRPFASYGRFVVSSVRAAWIWV